MSVTNSWQANAAWQMGLVPLAWVSVLRVARRVDASLWWVAAALGVSWLPDAAANHWPDDAWMFTFLYPATQSSLVAAVLILSRRRAAMFALAMLGVALLAVLVEDVAKPDWILYSVASFAVAVLAWPLWQISLRGPLLVYFGLGAIAWLVHVRWLIVPTWYPFQLCRAIGIGWFCIVSMRTSPNFRLVRP